MTYKGYKIAATERAYNLCAVNCLGDIIDVIQYGWTSCRYDYCVLQQFADGQEIVDTGFATFSDAKAHIDTLACGAPLKR